MNIEISDEMIEEILQKQIGEKVKAWFSQNKHEYVIKDFVNQAVMTELRDYKYENMIRDEARKQISKDVVERVCARISYDIADAFAEKYGD